MDLVIIVAMITPLALFILLTPVFHIIKKRREYNLKKDLEYIPLDDAIEGSIPLILEKGTKSSSFVIYSLKESEHFVQYGYEHNGFILYLFKSSIIDNIHLHKLQTLLVNHNFTQKQDTLVENLKENEFIELNSGFNVNLGEDKQKIKEITKEIFEKVFDAEELTVNAQYEI